MESWRKAWKGSNTPARPYDDIEWVERRKEFLAGFSDPTTVPDEVAANDYRLVIARWLIDRVDVLEEAGEISSEQAAAIRNAGRGQ